MNKMLPVAAVALVAVAGAAWYVARPAPSGGDLLPGAAGAQESPAAADVEVVEMSLGNPDAEVQVIEYASFTCPHCATFHDTVYPELKADYIDTGRIEFVYREVYFDRYGLWAGMVARCGGEDRYFAIADLIYERQRDWSQGEPVQVAENLRRIGKTAGLTDDQLDACLSDGAKAEALVAEFERNAAADDITSTPSFVIDGELFSNMSYDEFRGILDDRLGEDS